MNSRTKEKFASTKGLAPSADVKADSKFNKWEYVNGVLAVGMIQTAKAVDEGWIDPGYLRIAKDGWRGLENEVAPDGELMDVCVGTGIQDNIRFYYTRPRETNDTHGLGAFCWRARKC